MKKSALLDLFDDSSDAIVMFDISGVVIYSNKYARQLPGLFDEAKSRLIHPVVAHAANELTENSVTQSKKIELSEISHFFDNYNSNIHLIDENLVILSVRMTYADKSQTLINTFIDMVNHEVATPLQSLVLSGSLLEESLQNIDFANREELSKIKNVTFSNATKCLDSLKKVLEICRLYGDDPLHNDERIHPIELLYGAIDTCREEAINKKQLIKLECHETTALGMLYGSRAWLSRAIEECLLNAMRHAETKSVNRVQARQVGSFVFMVIKIQGKTLPGLQENSLYEPFKVVGIPADAEFFAKKQRKTEDNQPQLELGLSIASRIINLHGGQIRSMNFAEEGEFCIEIPSGNSKLNQNELNTEQTLRYASDLASIMRSIKCESILTH